VHFLSEELLMRLCSYPDYHEHLADHLHALETLRGVAAALGEGEDLLALRTAEDILGFLARHIATRDRNFAAYHLEWTRRAADLARAAPDIHLTPSP
jgi:hemerythrin